MCVVCVRLVVVFGSLILMKQTLLLCRCWVVVIVIISSLVKLVIGCVLQSIVGRCFGCG